MNPAVRVEGLVKRFKDTVALAGVDFEVPEASVLGLLGPNGAGKTTTVRVLSTLTIPDGGRASVCGFDVVSEPTQVRASIGLTGQYAAVDEDLTGFENLEMIGRLYQLGRRIARQRSTEMLERFDLAEAGGRTVKTYSGGMRRRLDIAASLIARPRVLFLDEPTTGLDIRSRMVVWDLVEDLVDEGTTILLTTQYLAEADRLADTIVVIDRGTVIARGTADELKAQVGGQRLEFTLGDVSDLQIVQRRLTALATDDPIVDEQARRLTIPVSEGVSALAMALASIEELGVPVVEAGLRRPDLDDVFLSLTGHVAENDVSTQSDDGEGQAEVSVS